MTRLAVLVPTLLALAGCCGSMGPAHPFASPPPLQKALDRVHDELSRKHDGLFYAGAAVVALARPGALVMHCLPAYRGKEIDEATFEANAQTIFDESENRLHVQKAILSWLVK